MKSAFDPFLLMLTLSQLRDKEKIIQLFTQKMQEAYPPALFQYQPENSGNHATVFGIQTSKSEFGFIGISGSDLFDKNSMSLISNAVKMLAVILEQLPFEMESGKAKKTTKSTYPDVSEDLKKTINSLEYARSASINLLEDLSNEMLKRKQAEEEIRVSETRLKRAELASKTGNWEFHIDTRKMIVSEGAAKIYGVSGNSFDYSFVNTFPLPEYRPMLDIALEDLLNGKKSYDVEFKIKTADTGQIKDIHSVALFDTERKVLFGIIQDITERKQSEEALKESEMNFRNLFENSPIGKSITSIDGSLHVNKTFSEITGYQEKELNTKKLLEITHPDDIAISTEKLQNLIDGKIEKVTFEKRYLHKNGNIVWVDVSSYLQHDETGKPMFFITTIADITNRKNTENELRETTDYLDNLLAYANAPIIVWDNHLRITKFNKAFERITGRTETDVIGEEVSILFPSVTSLQSLEHIIKASWGQRLEVVEIEICHINGSISTLLWNSAAIYSPDRKTIMATIAQGQDITGRKNAEAEINKLNEELEIRVLERTEQLEAANKELESFSYSASHDLRTPLRALDGFANILLQDYSATLDDEAKRMLNIIITNANKMGQLIDDLLSFSRIGKHEMALSEINMYEMAISVYDELASEKEKGSIQFRLQNIPKAIGDPALVRQVWLNLIGNAIKFSSRKPNRILEIGNKTENEENIFYVKDNGEGFEMNHSGNLFAVFKRLPTAKNFEGTGVGLAIAHRIVNRLNGRIWAEGKVGEGATFYFSLPAVIKSQFVDENKLMIKMMVENG